jgi:hypothetical protein
MTSAVIMRISVAGTERVPSRMSWWPRAWRRTERVMSSTSSSQPGAQRSELHPSRSPVEERAAQVVLELLDAAAER